MDLKIPYIKVKNKNDAYIAVKQTITPEYVSRYKFKIDITYDEGNGEVRAKGRGFSLTLTMTDTECQVKLALNFLLKSLKPRVLAEVEKEVKANL